MYKLYQILCVKTLLKYNISASWHLQCLKYILNPDPQFSTKHFFVVIEKVEASLKKNAKNANLLGGHFGHLSKNILYTRPVQRAHKKHLTFNFNVLFLFDLTLDFN